MGPIGGRRDSTLEHGPWRAAAHSRPAFCDPREPDIINVDDVRRARPPPPRPPRRWRRRNVVVELTRAPFPSGARLVLGNPAIADVRDFTGRSVRAIADAIAANYLPITLATVDAVGS